MLRFARDWAEDAVRSFRLVATVLMAGAALTAGALAQNGLERFEREIRPKIQIEEFT